ncbi:FKBP-type peptidyl-prolyl cis-trans isomerase N-terminal domain-containing protein [Singulisphaera rosea]
MKVFMVALAGFGVLVASVFADEPAAPKAGASQFKDLKQKVSYSIGLRIGKSMKSQSVEIDADMLAKGIKDAEAGKALMTDEEMQAVQLEFQKLMAEKQTQVADKQKKEGEAFLAANKKKEGVKTLPSGLQYKVVKEGNGKSPKVTDTVTAHYEGRLIDGSVFDSSIKRGEPADFPVNRVIKGWTEALQLMKKGGKMQIYVPSDLAYGASPPPGSIIRPNDPLIFDIELIDVK